MRYYEVRAKCGHVGRNNYYIGTLFLFAENGKEAAAVARKFPRVKHDHKDAILSVQEISQEQFREGRASLENSAYWRSENIQEQRMNCPELENLILHEEKKEKKYDKKHSLRKNYNAFDPLYTEYERYQGTIELEQL